MTVCVKLNIQNERRHGGRVHARQQMEHSEGDRAETIPRVTRIQKELYRKSCASKNRFVNLLGMH